ncbi:MAG: insulinase family protein [Alphaproteobacteria bacterium]|nr:insulinase family protein [Alphaproteobacteria bacterium]
MFKRPLLLSTIFTLSLVYCQAMASNISNDTITNKKVNKNVKLEKIKNTEAMDTEDGIENATEYDSDADTAYESDLEDDDTVGQETNANKNQKVNDFRNLSVKIDNDNRNHDNIVMKQKDVNNGLYNSKVPDNEDNILNKKDKIIIKQEKNNNNSELKINKKKDSNDKLGDGFDKELIESNEFVVNNDKNSLAINIEKRRNNMLNFNKKLFEDAEKLDTSDAKTREKISKNKIDARSVKWGFANDIWIVDKESESITFEIRFRHEGHRNFANDPGLLALVLVNIMEGTNTRSGKQIKELIENKSINIEIHGDVDDIIITVQCLNKYFNDVIDLICDVLTNANFPEDKIKQNKEAIILEYKQAKFNPKMLADEELRYMTFVKPYRRNIDGIIEKLPQYDKKCITDSYNKLFNPENAVITIVGNIKENKPNNNDGVLLEKDVKTGFDKIKSALSNKLKKNNNVNTFNPGEQTIELAVYKDKDGKDIKYKHVNLDNPQLIVMFALPGVARTDDDKIAIRAVNSILGNGKFDCRLMNNVREQNGLVYYIYTRLYDFDLQSVLVGEAATRPDNVNKVIDEIKKQITIIHDHGITEAELKDFKINKIASNVFATSYGLLNFVVSMRHDGIKINEINNYLEKYLTLTIKDINKALVNVFDPNKLVFVSCGMDPKVINGMKSNNDAVVLNKTNDVLVQIHDKTGQDDASKVKEIISQTGDNNQKNSTSTAEVEEIKYDVHNQINIQERVLENGMKVIVAPLNTKNSVCFGVGYFVGGFDDPRTTKGLSHFVEHMMFKQTNNLQPGEIKHHLCKYNIYTNAFTSYDITFYTHQCNKTFLELDMQIEADRMVNIQFDPKEVELEMGAIIEERKMRMESDPTMRYAYEALWKSLYLYSPYSESLIGYMDQIQACNAANLKEHYDKYYMPNNAFALFVGDIDIDEATKLCNKYFGNISKGPEIKRNIIVDPENTGITNKMTHQSEQITTTSVQIFYKIQKSKIDTMKKLLTISIANRLLTGGMSSILYKDLVEDKKILHTISSDLDVLKYDASILSINAVLQDGQNINNVEKEINILIEDFYNKILTKELFDREKQKCMDSFDLMLDNQIELNRYIIFKLGAGYSIDEIKNVKNILNSITYEDVKATAKDILDIKNQALVLYQMPEKKDRINGTKQNVVQNDLNKENANNKTHKEKIKDKMTDGLNKAKNKFKEITKKTEEKIKR